MSERRMSKMKKISNLEDLRKELSEEMIEKLFTEYMMEIISKAQRYDHLKDMIDEGATLKRIKEEI